MKKSGGFLKGFQFLGSFFMKRTTGILCIIALLGISYEARPQERARVNSLSDRAPNLDISVVRGNPVDLEKGRGKNVYIIEFWATWCAPCRYTAPHLSALQKKYRHKGLVVVGISEEDKETVGPYLEEMGDKMDYTVAIDRDQKTTARYMAAFNVNSIPHAFIVDRSGRMAWHGNPLLPSMEETLVALLDEKIGTHPRARTAPVQSGSGKKEDRSGKKTDYSSSGSPSGSGSK